MFRRARRMLNRGVRPAVPPLLKQANQLLASGDYAKAEAAFHQLAAKAENRFPQHAPFLYMQAGRSAILGNQNKKGVAYFRSGITLLGTQQRFGRLEKIGNTIISELRERALNAEADEIQTVLKNNLPASFKKETSTPNKKVPLPTHCPSCGAIVKPNEVEWLDEITAACDYCGSPIRETDRQ